MLSVWVCVCVCVCVCVSVHEVGVRCRVLQTAPTAMRGYIVVLVVVFTFRRRGIIVAGDASVEDHPPTTAGGNWRRSTTTTRVRWPPSVHRCHQIFPPTWSLPLLYLWDLEDCCLKSPTHPKEDRDFAWRVGNWYNCYGLYLYLYLYLWMMIMMMITTKTWCCYE